MVNQRRGSQHETERSESETEPDKTEESAPETASASDKVCTNCGQPAVWRTTNPGANEIYFCDRDRPQGEGVERIDG